MDPIRDSLDYDPETGLFIWTAVRRGVKRGQIAGSRHSSGYISIMIEKKNYLAHRLAWYFVYGVLPKSFVDHIDRNKTNNRIANLRLASSAQNLSNKPKSASNTSGVKGVSWDLHKKRWVAAISVGNKSIFLGRFYCKHAARHAYCAAARRYYGEFAYQDDPQDWSSIRTSCSHSAVVDISSQFKSCSTCPGLGMIPFNPISGHAGVYWEADRQQWTVKLRTEGRLKRIGRFETVEAALAARDAALARKSISV